MIFSSNLSFSRPFPLDPDPAPCTSVYGRLWSTPGLSSVPHQRVAFFFLNVRVFVSVFFYKPPTLSDTYPHSLAD